MNIQDLTRISDTEWEIPKSYRHDMRVPVRIFATRRSGRKIYARGEIYLPDGTVAITGKGLYIIAPQLFETSKMFKGE